MSAAERLASAAFDDLKPGDRIIVKQSVAAPNHEGRVVTTVGTVIRTERTHHGLHFKQCVDDKLFRDTILLEMPDGELTTVTIDERTVLNRA